MKKYQLIILFVVILSLLSLPFVYTRTEYEKANRLFVAGADIEKIDEKYINKGNTAVIRETDGVFDNLLLVRGNRLCSSVALEFNADRKNDDFIQTLYDIAGKYNVKYLILKEGGKKENDTAFVSALSKLIREKGLISVLKENKTQNGNELPFGTEEFLSASGMRVVRAYEPTSENNAYYRILNSITDRNTEFIIADSPTELKAVQKAEEKLKTYTNGKPEGFLTRSVPPRIIYALASAVTLLFILYIYLSLGGKKSKKVIYILIPLVFTAVFFLPSEILGFIRMVYVSAAPCFMLTVILFICRETAFSYKLKLPLVVLTSLSLSLVCGTLTGALFSGWRYHLGFDVFYEVAVALIIPVIYAGFLWYRETENKKFSENVLLYPAVLVIVAFYLVRSGNTEISSAERIFRDFLSDTFIARPRLKEFLFGWPLLFAAPAVLKNKKSPVLTGLVLFGCTVLFSSVVNSFCHGFTDISTSYMRTVWGFVAAIPPGLVAAAIWGMKSKTLLWVKSVRRMQ